MKAIVPQEPRHQRLLWGALSIVALTLIVVAVPAGLFEVGGFPVFHVDLGQAAKEISSHRTDGPRLISHWLIRGALILAWISWAWMTMCVILEIRSRLTGRSSARLPASRSVQSLAACLVGTTLAISTMGRVAVVPRATATPMASTTRAGPVAGSYSTGQATVMPLRVIDVRIPRIKRFERTKALARSPQQVRCLVPRPSRSRWVDGCYLSTIARRGAARSARRTSVTNRSGGHVSCGRPGPHTWWHHTRHSGPSPDRDLDLLCDGRRLPHSITTSYRATVEH